MSDSQVKVTLQQSYKVPQSYKNKQGVVVEKPDMVETFIVEAVCDRNTDAINATYIELGNYIFNAKINKSKAIRTRTNSAPVGPSIGKDDWNNQF